MIHPLVRKLESLGPLPDEDRELVNRLGDDVREFAPRHDVIHEGERPDHVHLMLDGWTCRYQMLEGGTRQITAFLVPGDFCDVHVTILGEMDHSIATLTPARIAFISRDAIRKLTDRPAIARALWWASLVDEAVLRAWIVNLGRRDAFERTGHLICEVHARLGHVGLLDGNEFQLPLTQEELGDALGLTPIHINRVLKRLREEGLLTLKRQQLTILDMSRLQAITGFDPNYLHLED